MKIAYMDVEIGRMEHRMEDCDVRLVAVDPQDSAVDAKKRAEWEAAAEPSCDAITLEASDPDGTLFRVYVPPRWAWELARQLVASAKEMGWHEGGACPTPGGCDKCGVEP